MVSLRSLGALPPHRPAAAPPAHGSRGASLGADRLPFEQYRPTGRPGLFSPWKAGNVPPTPSVLVRRAGGS